VNDHDDQGPGGTAGGESFSLEIRALKSDVPVFTRLKAVCKKLLRQHDFKLTGIVSTTPKLPPLQPPAAAGPGAGQQGEDKGGAGEGGLHK
jgi:hypothetical protein